jgi:hypothetical protein
VQSCGKRYTDPSSLRKHIKTQHGDHVYDIAKENKTRNGRGHDYGVIQLRDPSQRNNQADMPTTSQFLNPGQPYSETASTTDNSPDDSPQESSNNSPDNPPNEGKYIEQHTIILTPF